MILTATAATSSSIITAVSTVGFPIVMCGLLFWYIQAKMDKMMDALNANTAVMSKVLERLEKE
jgi:hypothetical protein